MFLVINKDKVCAYIVAIFTVIVLFGIANTYNVENDYMKVNAKTMNFTNNTVNYIVQSKEKVEK